MIFFLSHAPPPPHILVTSNDVEVVDIESETDNIDDIEDDPEEIFDIEFRNHKNAYYVNKLKATKVTK